MKPTLRPGLTFVRTLVVDRPRTIDFMGEEGRVYATPSMIMDCEQTCRSLILPHCDDNEDSVGIEVSMQHLAPTLLGMSVEIAATVLAVEGRKVVFEVVAKDPFDTIGRGRHTRFVADTSKRMASLQAKLARWKAERG